MDFGVIGSRGSSWTLHGDSSILLPLATLVTCVELCLALHVCFMSCMDSVCDLWLEFELGL